VSSSSEHFDAVVVGSGFGGSVTAYRLAEAGHSVCLLERGKPFPPNSFPRSPLGMKHQFWDPSEGLHGMFNLWSFDNIDAIVASGLGGGSLIYANVLLRKDEDWFVREEKGKGSWKDGYEYWPVTRADLDPHYDRVERMMNVQKYPLDQDPYDKTLKTLAFRDAAQKLGLDWRLVNLAVTFANDGDPAMVGEPIKEDRPNIHGRTRLTCKLTGECDLGCNHGSKNSLDFTYITAAWHAGADIRTRHEVRSFAPREGGGYSIEYVVHDAASEGTKTDTAKLDRHTITCDRLILGAGTLGTTYLLLKNRAAFPGLSPMLGTRFGGNGDLLTFARNCMTEVNGRKVPHVMDSAHAPVITSAIRVPDEIEGGEGRGFYLEDAGQPEFVSWMLQFVDTPSSLLEQRRSLPGVLRGLFTHEDSDVGAEIADLLGECSESSGFLPLLGMGRDVPRASCRCATAAWRSTGGRTAAPRSSSSACATSPGTSPRRSAERFSTTRSGCSAGSSPCTRSAAARWAATIARASSTPTDASSTTRACTSPTARSCPVRSGRTRASRSPASPTASPTPSSKT